MSGDDDERGEEEEAVSLRPIRIRISSYNDLSARIGSGGVRREGAGRPIRNENMVSVPRIPSNIVSSHAMIKTCAYQLPSG